MLETLLDVVLLIAPARLLAPMTKPILQLSTDNTPAIIGVSGLVWPDVLSIAQLGRVAASSGFANVRV